jgi:glucose-1-phosphate cytidylyltransferase
MKVVIFCGGLGIRMGEEGERIPKPLIMVGTRPILWHIMRWYASWGHTDFILCLGYRAESIKEYFLDYNEALGNDFVLAGREVTLLGSDTDEWTITFLDTGVHAPVGDRLLAAQPHIGDDEFVLCTYGDGLTDAPLNDMIDRLVQSGKTGLFMSVRPRLSYHVVDADDEGNVRAIELMSSADVRINGGFFVFRRSIFDELEPGEEIMEAAVRLALRGEMIVYRYDGFWAPMDTMKDKQDLDAIVANGRAPWVRPLPARSRVDGTSL